MSNTTSWPKLWESRIVASFQKQLQDWIDANDPRSKLPDALPRAKNFIEQAETIVLEEEISQWRIVNEKDRRDLHEVMPHAKDILIRFMTKPESVRARMEGAGKFLLNAFGQAGSAGLAMKETINAFRGIDFSTPVRIVRLDPWENHVFIQWFRGRLGNWFSKPGCSVDRLGIVKGGSPNAAGVFSNGRSYRLYRLKQMWQVDALESTASSVMDTWSDTDKNVILALLTSQNPQSVKRTVGTIAGGGGLQYFIPNPGVVIEDITITL